MQEARFLQHISVVVQAIHFFRHRRAGRPALIRKAFKNPKSLHRSICWRWTRWRTTRVLQEEKVVVTDHENDGREGERLKTRAWREVMNWYKCLRMLESWWGALCRNTRTGESPWMLPSKASAICWEQNRLFLLQGHLKGLVKAFARKTLSEELDTNDDKITPDTSKMLLSALEGINARKMRILQDALCGMPQTKRIAAHIIHYKSNRSTNLST